MDFFGFGHVEPPPSLPMSGTGSYPSQRFSTKLSGRWLAKVGVQRGNSQAEVVEKPGISKQRITAATRLRF
jgi:hypothetical protein